MAATPDGQRLCVVGEGCVRLVDRSMRTLHNLALPGTDLLPGAIYCAASDDAIFLGTLEHVRRVDLASVSVSAEYRIVQAPTAQLQLGHLALAPSAGLLFVAVSILELPQLRQHVLALDARTLDERFRFGEGVLETVSEMELVHDELYCFDFRRHALAVFSLRGEWKREVCGEWRMPGRLAFCNDRLYLVEFHGDAEGQEGAAAAESESEWSEGRKVAGKRIFVLTRDGTTLQVFDRFPTPVDDIEDIAVLGNRLVASVFLDNEELSHAIFELNGA